MEKSINIRFYLNFQKSYKSKLIPIYLRIIHCRSKLEKTTGLKILADDWDDKSQRSKTNTDINNKLAATQNDILQFQLYLKQKIKPFSIEALRSYLNNGIAEKTVLSYFEEYMLHAKEYNKLAKERLIKFNAVYNSLRDFINEEIKHQDIGFEKINYAFITQYHDFVKVRKSQNTNELLQPNTVSNYHKIFKQVLNEATNFQYLKSNPYKQFKLQWTKTSRECLSMSEIEKLETFDFGRNESLSNVRHLFLFSVYTGIRFSDSQMLTKSNLTIVDEKTYTLRFVQNKTSSQTIIPLLPQAIELIKKFQHNKRIVADKLLPTISNQKINAYLHVIASLVGINKELTYHIARYSFANTILLENDIDINVVSSLLGHSSIKVTKGYLNTSENALRKNLAKNGLYEKTKG